MIKKRVNQNIDGIVLLAQSIFKQALEDYQLALRGKKVYLDKKSYPPQEMVKDCELFFM